MRMKAFSIASFNLFNLNAPGLPMYGKPGLSQEAHDRKVAWTRFMLGVLRADVVAVQELWHPAPLQEALDGAGLGPEFAVLAPPDLAGGRIACAAVVRRDMLDGEPEWITEFPPGLTLQSRGDDPQTPAISVKIGSFSRPVMHLRLKPRSDRSPVHVFVAHFKSKGPTAVFRETWFRKDEDLFKPHAGAIGAALSTIRRTAEAAALRVILTGIMKGSDDPVIVLGDLNDDHNSNTLNILSEQPVFLRPLALGGRDTALYSGQALQEVMSQKDVYYTYIHQGVHGSLDHILVSEQFYPNSRKRVWSFDGLDIYNDHLNSDDHKAQDGTNDHGIIRARFVFAPARAAPDQMEPLRGSADRAQAALAS